jgi:ribonucleoside-diphosphate reductase alpha chain
VRARKMAEDARTSFASSDTSGPANGGGHSRGGGSGNGGGNGQATGNGGNGSGTAHRAGSHGPMRTVAGSQPATTRAAAEAFTDTPPVVPARMRGLDLGPACSQCGGMMQRTGSCYTCSSCGNNTGCG